MCNKQMFRHSEWSSFKPFEPNPGPKFHCSLAALVKSHRYYFSELGNLA